MNHDSCRYFVTYSGIKLPLKLTNELSEASLKNRNTFFRGYFDSQERVVKLEKIVYGELEMQHVYTYHENGTLQKAEITDSDDELVVLSFDENGQPV
ncbi:DUF6156 family protein [Azomonas macrocytogenes]|uniref:Uncharacterized protein n=1 Tax=Azomonas macrocytogenes TaxID=69962 RepID=A0A839T9Q6_AZOMA|nr:DUF6156 family protein [Azomonas macrocytogenes]MBB3104765.1 hypothetical protein [Azomonas macrocytogenes]